MRILLKTKTGTRTYEVDPDRLGKAYIRRKGVYYRAYRVIDDKGRIRKTAISRDKIIRLPQERAYRRYEPDREFKLKDKTITHEQFKYLYRKEGKSYIKYRNTAPVISEKPEPKSRYQAKIVIRAYVKGKQQKIIGYSSVRKAGDPKLAQKEAMENAMHQSRGFVSNTTGRGGSDTDPDKVVVLSTSFIRWI